MFYYDFTVGNKTYKLRLNTRIICTLEKQIGCNPLLIFGDGDTIPTVSTMVNILYCALVQFNHGISLDDAFTIFDEWLSEGHTVTDFINVILEIYKVSGLIAKGGEDEKNVNTEVGV